MQQLIVLFHLVSHVACAIDIILAFAHYVVGGHPDSQDLPLGIEVRVLLSFALHESPLLIHRAKMSGS